jgi:hypothetical protein
MRRSILAFLVSTSALALAGFAQAQSCTPAGSGAGTVTSHVSVSDTSSTAALQTMPLKLTYSNGVTANLTLAASSSTQAVAFHTISGVTTTVTVDLISISQTRVKISRPTVFGAPSLKVALFGGPTSRVAFDIVSGTVVTAGSGVGQTFAPITMTGNPWVASPYFVDRVSVGGSAALTDLHKTLRITFTTAMTGGTLTFLTDTDNLL